jgi:hypothetical protein
MLLVMAKNKTITVKESFNYGEFAIIKIQVGLNNAIAIIQMKSLLNNPQIKNLK